MATAKPDQSTDIIAILYEDFQPRSENVTEEKSDTVLLYLPEFKKEHVRVQVDNYGLVKIRGERPIEGSRNKYSRFHKEFYVPRNCNTSAISAKFENAILYVILPKQDMTNSKAAAAAATTTLPIHGQPERDQASYGSSDRWIRAPGGGLMSGLKKRGMVVSVMVVAVAVGVYVAYKQYISVPRDN